MKKSIMVLLYDPDIQYVRYTVQYIPHAQLADRGAIWTQNGVNTDRGSQLLGWASTRGII